MKYMQRALQLARKANPSPNPKVGCVIVKNKKIIGEGYHKGAGLPHAEIEALKKVNAKGATIYVTLEPCCHHGKTPPCTEQIIKAGIKKVVIAQKDPFPKVNGKGVKQLLKAGIVVKIGVLKKEAKEMNKHFLTSVTLRRPYIYLKAGMTLDGKIAASNRESKWITSEKARKIGHGLRSAVDGVVVGINTVVKDNPSLTTRLVKGKNAVPIILDNSLRIPLKSNVLKRRCIIITSKKHNQKKRKQLLKLGHEVPLLGNLKQMCKYLVQQGIQSILVEGGGQVHASFITADLFDEIYFFIAPKILGGGLAVTQSKGRSLDKALPVTITTTQVGKDLLLHGQRYPAMCK